MSAGESRPKRILLNKRQMYLFLKDMKDFGYETLTIKEVERISREVADGTYNTKNIIAVILAKQIDQATEALRVK